MKLHIGLDDTDSKKGMCTTYLGAVLRDRLVKFSEVLELRLVRLNPNIPWKTRGNGAVAITIDTEDRDRVVSETIQALKKYSAVEEKGTNPGAVFYKGEINDRLSSYYFKALREVVKIEEAEALAQSLGCEIHKLNNGRGIIGALAAIGADLSQHTFEIITYRHPENWGQPRNISSDSVFEMDRRTRPFTFNNVDWETHRILITPRSPCPVLFGIRAHSRGILETAMDAVEANEPIERYAIFKTNQGTDAHLTPMKISQVQPYRSVIVKGTVLLEPKSLSGGHVVFAISENNSKIDCAAYEPTGGFRGIVKGLRKGDIIKAYGGVKNTKRLTINLEKLEVLTIKECFSEKNPICPLCRKRMESAGKGQGFRCRMCRTGSFSKEFIPKERDLKPGLYSVPLRAMRHISRPL